MADLERGEMIEILEGIARDGSPGLQIQAIRALVSLRAGEDEPDEEALEQLIRRK